MFKAYYKSRTTGEVESRECVRVDERDGVVWLKNGGWLRLEDTYLTRERAEKHDHLWVADITAPKSEDDR